MADLGESFPEANFLVTGINLPDTNAHGPNENIDLAFCKKLITAISMIMEDFVKF